ncbi:MAG: hypothetical protein WCW52_08495 [Elusimicrobiales bacterium]
MKKSVRSGVYVLLIALSFSAPGALKGQASVNLPPGGAGLSGSAIARPNDGRSPFETFLANTDAQLASGIGAAMDRAQAAELPAPAVSRTATSRIRLVDITKESTREDEVVSAYPGIYKLIPSEENARIIKVFVFTDPEGIERRIEVYFTGGDWMRYGITYLTTNAGRSKNRVNAYFVRDLSTADKEEGSVPPSIDPFDSLKLADFITADFLGEPGEVKPEYKSIAEHPIP